MQTFTISKSESNQTLLKYLNRILPNCPKGLIYKQLRNKNITLNKAKANGNEKLKENDIIYIYMSDDTISKFSESESINTSEYIDAYSKFKEPDIIYEDNHILIINKPVGMLSQKSKPNDISANEWLIGYLLNSGFLNSNNLVHFKPSVCNRLDRNTGGLLIMGKSLFGTNIINDLLRDRSAHKYYRTIVQGKITESCQLQGFLLKDEKTNKVHISNVQDKDSEYIETEYFPIRYSENNNITELEVNLITGKPHQIRAHLSSINHPIIGDKKYNADMNKSFGLKHQLLYAVRIEFPELKDYQELSNKVISINLDSIFNKYFN